MEVDWGEAAEVEVVLDRVKVSRRARRRLLEAVEEAWRLGKGTAKVRRALDAGHFESGDALSLVQGLACPSCHRRYPAAHPHLFSFNSGRGACPECGGYGSTLELDPDKVVPDPEKSLRQGAIHPFTMPSFRQAQGELLRACRREGVDVDTPYWRLPEEHRAFVFHGDHLFFGVDGLFEYLETKKYKMHVRVLLARFRHGVPCEVCGGTRLTQEALAYELWGRDPARGSRP